VKERHIGNSFISVYKASKSFYLFHILHKSKVYNVQTFDW